MKTRFLFLLTLFAACDTSSLTDTPPVASKADPLVLHSGSRIEVRRSVMRYAMSDGAQWETGESFSASDSKYGWSCNFDTGYDGAVRCFPPLDNYAAATFDVKSPSLWHEDSACLHPIIRAGSKLGFLRDSAGHWYEADPITGPIASPYTYYMTPSGVCQPYTYTFAGSGIQLQLVRVGPEVPLTTFVDGAVSVVNEKVM